MNRRKFLVGSGFAAVSIPLGYILWGHRSRPAIQMPESGKYLSPAERLTLLSLASTVLGNWDFPDSKFHLTHEQFLEGSEKLFAASQELQRNEFRLLLRVIEHGIPLLGFHRRRFSNLSVEDRSALFQRLETSKLSVLRLLAKGCKMLVNFSFFTHPQVHAQLGYDRWCNT